MMMDEITKDRYEVARDDLSLDMECIRKIEANIESLNIESLKFMKRYLENKLASVGALFREIEKEHFVFATKLLKKELLENEAVLKDVKSVADADFKIVEQYFEENAIKFEDGENDG